MIEKMSFKLELVNKINEIIDKVNELGKEKSIAEENLKGFQDDLTKVYKELGFPEDTILPDEFVPMIKEKYISKEKIREKIKEKERRRDNSELNFTSALFERDINTLLDLLGDE